MVAGTNLSTLVTVLAAAALLKLVVGLTLALVWRRRRARQGLELAYHLDPGRQQIHRDCRRDDDAVEHAGAS